MEFGHQSSFKRLTSMLKVDFRRMFKTKSFYIMFLVTLVIPILILVMTTMVEGGSSNNQNVTVDSTIVEETSKVEKENKNESQDEKEVRASKKTGRGAKKKKENSNVNKTPNVNMENSMPAFTNTWQMIGTVSGGDAMTGMDMTAMMNINMVYFFIAVFVCTFVAEDFRSGYAKVLFTGRSKKKSYVTSKFIVGCVQGVSMLIAWLIGSIIGGAIAGLSFDLGVAGVFGLVMCLLAKTFIVPIFVALFLALSTFGKQKLWLSLTSSLIIGMLFFTIVPMMTPLNSGIMNAGMCLVGGLIFGIVINLVSNAILSNTDLV